MHREQYSRCTEPVRLSDETAPLIASSLSVITPSSLAISESLDDVQPEIHYGQDPGSTEHGRENNETSLSISDEQGSTPGQNSLTLTLTPANPDP